MPKGGGGEVGWAENMREVLALIGASKADPTADMQLLGALESLIVAKLHQPPQIPGAMPNPLAQAPAGPPGLGGGPPGAPPGAPPGNLRSSGPPAQQLAAGMTAPDELRRMVGANANA